MKINNLVFQFGKTSPNSKNTEGGVICIGQIKPNKKNLIYNKIKNDKSDKNRGYGKSRMA